ncbi:MAG: ABC transporter permease [Spirochaetes bacterium]|nr:ABC transporter permease [Spirochaetota bacterium]
MIFKFALRNVLRNKKRSFFTVLTIFLAAIVVGFSQGWINGLIGVYINNFTKYMTGHVRISTEEYIKREKFLPVDELINDSDNLVKDIAKLDGVSRVRERIRFGLLLGNRENTTESIGMGINLKNNEFDLANKLVQGEISDTGIYIGEGLAEKLSISHGQDLLIATKTSEGGLNGIKLKVQGIFKLRMAYDKKMFFISLDNAKKLLKIHNGTTELLVFADDVSLTDDLKSMISAFLPQGLNAQTYKEQIGEFYNLLSTMKSFYSFILTLILFLASFVIINTMMMAIFERIREIGTMKAMGMSDRELFLNFTFEGAILGTAGGISGAVAGFFLILLVAHNGIDFTTQIENLDMPFEYILKPQIGILELLIALGISIIVPSLAAMLPARYAKKLMPAEALRK